MAYVVVDSATGVIKAQSMHDALPFDSATQIRVQWPNMIADREGERWDAGTSSFRRATAQELEDAKSAQQVAKESFTPRATGTITREEFDRLLDSLGY